MKNTMWCAMLLCTGLCSTATSIFAQSPGQNEELKKFQGFWKCTSLEYDAKEQLPPNERGKITLVVKDTEYRMYALSNPEKQEYLRLFTAQMTLGNDGRSFELVVTEGHEKGKKIHGIYEWNGHNFRICYGAAEKPRPSKFETTVGSGYFLETWQLEKR